MSFPLMIYGKIGEIIGTLQNIFRPGMTEYLENNLDQLRDAAQYCLECSTETEKEFDTWLILCTEIHVACENKHGSTVGEAQKLMSESIKNQIELQNDEKVLATTKEAAERMKKSLDKAEDMFKQANDAVPGPWESMAITAVNGLVQAVPSMLAQALPMVLMAADPAMAIGPVIGGLGNIGKEPAGNTGKPGKPNSGKPGKNKAPISAPQVLPINDPTPATASTCVPFFTLLNAAMTSGKDDKGKRGAIDWEKFSDGSAGKDSKGSQGITYLTSQFKWQLNHGEFVDSSESERLKSSIEAVIEVLEEIKTVMDESSSMNTTTAEEKTIKVWQGKVKRAETTVTGLASKAATSAGAPGKTPTLRPAPFEIPPTDFTAQNAALDAAMQKVAINQQNLNAATDNYNRAMENQSKIEGTMATIRGKLASLDFEKATLEDVKKVLIECINTLVQLKVQVAKIKQFFTALNVMVEVVVKQRVSSFDKNITSLSATSIKYGQLTVNDHVQQSLYSSTLQLKAYFDLMHDIAKMYIEVHTSQIAFGMNMVDEMSKLFNSGETGNMPQKRQDLDDYAAKSAKFIKELVSKTQKDLNSGLKNRIQTLAEDTRMLEAETGQALSERKQAAILEAAAENISVVKEGFDNAPSAVVIGDKSMDM
ncbi:hypothetical protein MBLNU459_g1990t2 [Dothideomycetes sp. NU459]